eukprot:gb/GECG01014518.1/.p1 GENE.gb/GECG01014518.1/~~gb/GECG01014518.1/.p1  ORF type:complete len:119 (+),score=14.34 gb/GECG01014518.1/:1-357(+)
MADSGRRNPPASFGTSTTERPKSTGFGARGKGSKPTTERIPITEECLVKCKEATEVLGESKNASKCRRDETEESNNERSQEVPAHTPRKGGRFGSLEVSNMGLTSTTSESNCSSSPSR